MATGSHLNWMRFRSSEQREILEHLTLEESEEWKRLSKEMDRELARKRGPRLLLIVAVAYLLCFVAKMSYQMQGLVLVPLVFLSMFLDVRAMRMQYREKQLALLNRSKYAKERKSVCARLLLRPMPALGSVPALCSIPEETANLSLLEQAPLCPRLQAAGKEPSPLGERARFSVLERASAARARWRR